MRSKFSTLIKLILLHSGFYWVIRKFFSRKELAILRYHAVQDKDKNLYASPGINISPKIFEKHVCYFSRRYKVISLDEAVQCLDNRHPFPKNSVVFSFDDGYADNYRAYQILKKYGATGAFYITARCIDNSEALWLCEVHYLLNKTQKKEFELLIEGKSQKFMVDSDENKSKTIRSLMILIKSNNLKFREDIRKQLRDQLQVYDLESYCLSIMLTAKQIKEMSRNGMTIAAHTMTHANLPNAAPEEAKAEINDSKKALENLIGDTVLHFSYPNGGGAYEYYNDTIKNMVKEAGFISSTTSRNALATIDCDPLEIPRMGIRENLSELLYLIEGDRILTFVKLGLKRLFKKS